MTIKKNLLNYNNNYLNSSDKFLFYNNLQKSDNNYHYFNLSSFKYFVDFKSEIVMIEYNIGFYDRKENLISPSDLKLYTNLSVICHIEISNIAININSLASIYQNKYYNCIEFFNINEKIKFGIKIYKNIEEGNNKNYIIYFFKDKIIDYNNLLYQNNRIFSPIILNNEYISLNKKMNNKKINETLKLKNSFIRYPYYTLKRYSLLNNNSWIFNNIFNHYFCLCNGEKCLNIKFPQKCKYYLYLNIIDKNRYIYSKTDYLFVDFIFANLSFDDAFPVFHEMEKQGLPVHYITEKIDIYNKYCLKKRKCLTIILVNSNNYTINGDFLEKYLTFILKLKQVISGGGTNFNFINNNIFFNIEYITYISITHGVCYFKYFLYKDYGCYSLKRIDKILLPPSEMIISVAKNYGWKDENIIKINLPRWDKYNNISSNFRDNLKNNSIFILFTWRDINKKEKISSYYLKNIIELLRDNFLNNALKKKNILLYFTFHHLINKYNEYQLYLQKMKSLRFIKENEISECLAKTSLVVTDFSSIVFDIIYRKKPYIIFVPDANDTKIEKIYKKNYVNLIQLIKNGTIKFENTYFNVNDTVNKIIYYINNKFEIELNLKKFYEKLSLKEGNNIIKFIEYIKNLK